MVSRLQEEEEEGVEELEKEEEVGAEKSPSEVQQIVSRLKSWQSVSGPEQEGL